MAEPRKPRVIKTRPGTTPPRRTAPGATPPGTAPRGGQPAPDVAGKPAAGAVRRTSSKVSVEPLPGQEAAASTAAPSKPPAPKSLKPKVGASKLLPAKGGASTLLKPQGVPSKAVPTKAEPATTGGGQDGPIAQVLAFPVPLFKRRRRTIVYSVAGIVAVLALVMCFALFSPVLAVRTVVFDGQKLVDPKILEHAVAPIYGKPLPQVTADEVQTLLGQVVQVKSSSIEARPPSTLRVSIVERIPVALLKNEDAYLLVDQEGVELGTTTDPASAALPLIDGGKAAIGQDTFKAMTEVLANLPQPILAQLANATAASPDAVELKLVDGRSVIWGDASDMELKAVVLETLLNAPAPAPAAGAPAPEPVNVFDVSAPRRPVTR